MGNLCKYETISDVFEFLLKFTNKKNHTIYNITLCSSLVVVLQGPGSGSAKCKEKSISFPSTYKPACIFITTESFER